MNQYDLAERLGAPFEADEVEWRVGSTTKDKSKGMALAYIDARTVMRRLDDVVGVSGWQCENKELRGGKLIICSIGIHMENGEWIWKSDGAGDTAVEAEKGVLSDAFKRAAVRWGIGRYLYDLPSPWVALDGDGRRIAPAEVPRLQKIVAEARAAYEKGRPVEHVPSKQEVDEIVQRLTSAKTLDEVRALAKKCWPIAQAGMALDKGITDGVRRFDPTYDPSQKSTSAHTSTDAHVQSDVAQDVPKPSLQRAGGQKARTR